MFICTKRPREEHFPADLNKLGFKYEDGQYVGLDPPHAHFECYHTDNEKVNDRRKEAMHESIRQSVAQELEKFGVKYLYLHGQQGTSVSQEKPEGPHVRILATEVSKLQRKKDVIVVVGEAGGDMQDAGIWAYRVVSREGGTEQGSAVGMAARIARYAQAASADDPVDDVERMVQATHHMSLADIRGTKDDGTPALVILNPGQLRYSHIEQKPMTQPTWLARLNQSSIKEPYRMNERYNRVQGHQSAHNHIVTCFEHVFPQLLREDARVYLAVIGDSAKSTIDYLDQLWLNKNERGLTRQLQAIAIIEGNEEPECVFSEHFRAFLEGNGKKWMHCPRLPLGRLIQTPGTGNILDIADFPFVPPQRNIEVAVPSNAETKPEEAPSVIQCIEAKADTKFMISTANTPEHGDDEDTTYVDVKDEAYDEYRDLEVLCPTFSAGDCGGITELVFPRVMDKVLELFWHEKEKAEHMEVLYALRKAKEQKTMRPLQAPAA